MIWKIRRFWQFLKRVYSYLPILWSSCDCDHSEVTDVFQHQLKRLVKHLKEHQNHCGWEHTVCKGERLIRLGGRVFEDRYELEPFGDVELGSERWHSQEFKDECAAARAKQAKANRIYWNMVNYYLPFLWD